MSACSFGRFVRASSSGFLLFAARRAQLRDLQRQLGLDEQVDDLHRRRAAGRIGVEHEHDFAGEALEQLDLLAGHGRALRRDRVVDPVLMQGHDVEVALDDERATALANGVLGHVQTE